MSAVPFAEAVTLEEIREFDKKYAIESDAYAYFDATLDDDYRISVQMVTGDPNDEYCISIREARCLAASLLAAADAAEKAGARTT